MTIKEMIDRYGIRDAGNGQLQVTNVERLKRDNALEELKARKAETLAYFAEQKRAAEEREAKIAAIEGLTEIRAALADMAAWHREFNRSMDNEALDGIMSRPAPKHDMDSMYAKYPRAKAFLDAEKAAHAVNIQKSVIGKKALERIINGEDHETVMADMQAELKWWAESHMWD